MTTDSTDLRPTEEPWKTLVGPPERVIEQLRTYAALGVTEAVFDFRSCSRDEMVETMRRCAQHVIPAVAGW